MRVIVPLTDAKIKSSKPKEKPYKLSDGGGLTLVIRPNGLKNWVFRIRVNGKETNKSLGYYPQTSLKVAREKAKELKDELTVEKKSTQTFRIIASQYWKFRSDLTDDYIKDNDLKLEAHIFDYIGDKEIEDITVYDMINCISRMNDLGLQPTAKKVFGTVDRIFRYAVTNRLTSNNPMASLDKSLLISKVEKNNFKHTTNEKELKQLLKAIEDYSGYFTTKCCLKIAPYVFVRPANLAQMKWGDIDFDKNIWNISKDEMKTKRDFIVPLSDTVMSILKELKSYGFGGNYVFRSQLTKDKPISRDTLSKALKRLDFDLTTHGFRHTASTLLNENKSKHGISSDVIELQLAHTLGGVRGVYNKSENIEDRIKLMKWWSDYLDSLKKS